jgi:beta-glucosidase
MTQYKLVFPNYTTLEDQTRVDLEREQFLNNELKNFKKNMHANNTIIIGVLGESPYAEVMGDVAIPYCKGGVLGGDGCLYNPDLNPYLPPNQRTSLELEYEKFDHSVIASVREADKNIPLLTILVTGRPMLINNVTNISSAILAAWLPGTTGGQAIVDSITGDYSLRPLNRTEKVNTLAFDWPSTQVKII